MRPIAFALLLCLACVPMTARPADAGQRFLVFGDPQPKSAADVDYFARDIVEPARSVAKGSVATIVLGDISNDAPALYPGVKSATKRLGIPVLFAPGNHDMDAGAESDAASLGSWHKAFGADTYMRKFDSANVIVLDDVIARPGQSPGYVGGLREDQFKQIEGWLRASAARQAPGPGRAYSVLRHLAGGRLGELPFRRSQTPVRIAASLPARAVAECAHPQPAALLPRCEGRVAGQGTAARVQRGRGVRRVLVGRADAQGIPDATMSDGTPNGYATLDVKADGSYALAWHPARDPADTQIALHAPKVLRRGAYPALGVYANVYMGHASTRVEYRVDDGDWMPMKRVVQADPRLVEENVRDDAADTLRGFDRSPEAEPSTHLWRGALPTKLDVGEHTVEVRAFDTWRGETRAKTTYRLDEP